MFPLAFKLCYRLFLGVKYRILVFACVLNSARTHLMKKWGKVPRPISSYKSVFKTS